MTDDELFFKIMFPALFTFTFRPFFDFPGIPITVKISICIVRYPPFQLLVGLGETDAFDGATTSFGFGKKTCSLPTN